MTNLPAVQPCLLKPTAVVNLNNDIKKYLLEEKAED